MKNVKFFFSVFLILIGVNSYSQYWSTVFVDTTGDDYRTIAFSDKGRGFISGAETGCVYYSDNGGLNWASNVVINGDGINALQFVNDTLGYGAGSDGVFFRTTDNGSTWDSLMEIQTEPFYGLFFLDENTGWMIGKQGVIFKTINGGMVWSAQTSGTTASLWNVYFMDANIGIIAADGRLLKSTNGGASWTETYTDFGKQFKDFHFINHDTGYVVANMGVILKTTDAGQSWTSVYSGSTSKHFKSIYFENEDFGIVAGLSGVVLRTLDGGSTWQQMSLPSPANIEKVIIHNNDTALLVGEDGAAFINTRVSGIGEWEEIKPDVKVWYGQGENKLFLESEVEFEIFVYDISGKLVLKKQFKGNGSVDLTEKGSRVYLYHIINEDGLLMNGKFVKKD